MSKKPEWPPAPYPPEPDPNEYEHLSEMERKNAGYPCDFSDPELVMIERKARILIREFNDSHPEEDDHRQKILSDLLHPMSNPSVHIEPPFYIDYGQNIKFGENVYVNFGCTFMDTAPITIGKNGLIAPGVSILTATHPLDPKARLKYALAKPISIGVDVWIGGRAVICPGWKVR